MWSERECEELAVWADQLQAQGDPLGELVATSLLADALGGVQRFDAPPPTAQVMALRARVRALEATIRDPIVAELSADCPGLETNWEHGMLVSLRAAARPSRGPMHMAPLRRLLRLPAARFLRHLRIDTRASEWTAVHHELPALLAEPEIVARPWSIVLGFPPRHLRRRFRVAELEPAQQRSLAALVDPRRGLRNLFLDTARVELPWQRGDKGTRGRAAASLVSGRPEEAASLTRLARALWDPSVRVRLLVIDSLPLLGTDAAALVPELLLVERGEHAWVSRVREVLDTLARNPEVVSAVALNFTVDQPHCASWLAASPLAVARLAAPRLRAMLEAPTSLDLWIQRELSTALATIDQRSEAHQRRRALDDRNPASQPLLQRLHRWLRS